MEGSRATVVVRGKAMSGRSWWFCNVIIMITRSAAFRAWPTSCG